jgi:hypothetical protein
MRYLIAVCLLLSGCAIPLHISYDKSDNSVEKPIVEIAKIRLKDSKQVIIRAIMIEGSLSEPEATVLWVKYTQSDYKDFITYLIEINPHDKQVRIYKDFVERVKVRTKMLKRRANEYVNKI